MALTIILNTINPRYNKAALLELSFIQNFSQSEPKRMHLKLDYTKHIDKLLHLERTVKGHVYTHGGAPRLSCRAKCYVPGERATLSVASYTNSCHPLPP